MRFVIQALPGNTDSPRFAYLPIGAVNVPR